ncbi:unnamed protein product [Dibothriocephalus latus]|uniref:Uncharacterized protein n=1 Tax=Dibothriocephalus latus TaxID=60516 RepID=A0A3P7LEY4_DIBLA|nr:unnamed protein product [Dibothriocephalus latus]
MKRFLLGTVNTISQTTGTNAIAAPPKKKSYADSSASALLLTEGCLMSLPLALLTQVYKVLTIIPKL